MPPLYDPAIIDVIRSHAKPLLPAFRSAFLERVDELLRNEREIGVGSVSRACAIAQKMFLDTDAPRPSGIRR